MERRIQDYIQGFIHNQYWCYFYSSPIRNAYFYIIERYMLVKYKDLHVHPNKIFHLYLDEYWRVHDQDYLYQPSSEGQRSEILSIVAETKKTREKIDVFLSINDTRLARNQLLHGYQFTPALNKLLINLPYSPPHRRLRKHDPLAPIKETDSPPHRRLRNNSRVDWQRRLHSPPHRRLRNCMNLPLYLPEYSPPHRRLRN